MARGVRDPGPVSRHISPKQREKKGRTPKGTDQCLTWINVCLSALGRFLAWRSASSHSFLTLSERNAQREKQMKREMQGGPPAPVRSERARQLPKAVCVKVDEERNKAVHWTKLRDSWSTTLLFVIFLHSDLKNLNNTSNSEPTCTFSGPEFPPAAAAAAALSCTPTSLRAYFLDLKVQTH